MTEKTKYAITRIIGNELPPRDFPGSRLKVLEFIVNHEFVSKDSSRLWLLNRILNQSYLTEVKRILDQAGERYIEETVDWPAYTAAFSRDERLRILININRARNRCIDEGRKQAEFTLVLDGDCFFDQDSWTESTNFIADDQLTNSDRKYYAHGLHRLILDSLLPVTQNTVKLEEPIVVFRADADLRFDESLPFGRGDKQDLLTRIGLVRTGESWCQEKADTIGALGGIVRHLQTGSISAESDFRVRMKVRQQSLDDILNQADQIVERDLGSNQKWGALLRFRIMRGFAKINGKARV